MLGLIGKKKGMTQIFDQNGDYVPVTVVELGPCVVVQKKTVDSDGYNALQLGYASKRASRMTKAMRGHFEKKSLPLFAHLKEFRMDDVTAFNQGDELCVSGFKAGDMVAVSGFSKGRGFQGVMKRHGKHGGPAAHGSDFHRRPGSIGMRTWPGRVFKNTRLPGHMGDTAVTIKNLQVAAVMPEENAILIRGAIPGCREGLVEVVLSKGCISERAELKKTAGNSSADAAPIAESKTDAPVAEVATEEQK